MTTSSSTRVKPRLLRVVFAPCTNPFVLPCRLIRLMFLSLRLSAGLVRKFAARGSTAFIWPRDSAVDRGIGKIPFDLTPHQGGKVRCENGILNYVSLAVTVA